MTESEGQTTQMENYIAYLTHLAHLLVSTSKSATETEKPLADVYRGNSNVGFIYLLELRKLRSYHTHTTLIQAFHSEHFNLTCFLLTKKKEMSKN